MMIGRNASRLAIGLGVPFIAVVPTIPLLDRISMAWHGVPISVLWLFGCIPLTSACLATCWWLFDRHAVEPHDSGRPDTGQHDTGHPNGLP
ncbi:DUF3311 domain-containing protein [Lichenicola cladoniae]|uniref:DUF3311 domain-containing protein n=1 Tax=Lichenicola cladoniae TaxID=1484109 RepID=A0A6M8HJS0_9PROT|nr:DUF3311 domain-containing protein [Lichenicola cladoniae]NPD66703.1 DUF3311 domain-containing protein [Acetobacteraceae bacterium]QKE88656.1 DUF3311 domain-containing protein [Lichenicola cladoniae]